MFTGIIEEKAKMTALKKVASDSYRMTVTLPEDWTASKGQSIAVNGACLTVSSVNKGSVDFDVMPETIHKTAFGKIKKNEEVNLERAMPSGGRFEGHIVQGHVDGTGLIKSKVKKGNSFVIQIKTESGFTDGLVDKGSVAVDGISLTVSKLLSGFFEVSIIPLTAEKTTLGFKKPGDYVNLEADVLGKYVSRYLEKR